ncbi:uncharacterized protein PHALS_09995 [Plasmopara halstedii]|uniref:Uncharacterized protein n=1 Tax=Plasmopara halstedii TaxID=4781 RepID=A0A0P1AH04_PLAHL|nr:uncharacterized protein PHALS_09995 [Plasmopara halstedii]CEG39759.1 hypothetical protein PHALS_09995 [Plasmopara halstedii]|eukprot:XP_024576128.1 hypothetical protein PHALS_09995 [Plasmopara halstedii]
MTCNRQSAISISKLTHATDHIHFPVLPNFASLLNRESINAELEYLESQHVKDISEIRARKVVMELKYDETSETCAIALSTSNVFVQQQDQPHFPLDWSYNTSLKDNTNNLSMSRAVDREGQPERVTATSVVLANHVPCTNVTSSSDVPAESNYLCHHDVGDPTFQTAILPLTSQRHSYEHENRSRTYAWQNTSNYSSAAYTEKYEDEDEGNFTKRRHVIHMSPSRQHLCEPENSMNGLEPSKMHVNPLCLPSIQSMVKGDGSQWHSAQKNVDKIMPIIPLSINGNRSCTSVVKTNSEVSRPSSPQLETRTNELCTLETLVRKSDEFLNSKSLVRNRHDEIDWVATFLKVGFDSSSIFSSMCPLRKGRWKSEEENYTMSLLRLIENGTIFLRHGQSIRNYVGEKLHSDDMRVLKKLSNCKMYRFAKNINLRLAEAKALT